MRLYNARGRLVNKNVTRYLIKWDGKSKSNIQFRVKQFLKPFWRGHIVYEEFPVYGTLMTVDLLNASYKIAIEVQGQQHTEFHYFHGGKPVNYLDAIKRDVKKQEWLQKNDFQLIEINYDEIDSLSCQFFLEKFNLVL
jgi:hypothetical protein